MELASRSIIRSRDFPRGNSLRSNHSSVAFPASAPAPTSRRRLSKPLVVRGLMMNRRSIVGSRGRGRCWSWTSANKLTRRKEGDEDEDLIAGGSGPGGHAIPMLPRPQIRRDRVAEMEEIPITLQDGFVLRRAFVDSGINILTFSTTSKIYRKFFLQCSSDFLQISSGWRPRRRRPLPLTALFEREGARWELR